MAYHLLVRISLLGIVACLSFPAHRSFAGAPILFQACPNIAYKSDQGPLIFDSECKAGYLLPGSNGTMEVTGSLISVTDDQCAAVKAAESAALGAFGDAAARQAKRKEIQKRRDELATQSSSLATQRLQLVQARSATKNAFDASSASIIALEKQYLDDCGNDPAKSLTCYSISTNLTKQRKINATASKQLEGIETLLAQVTEQEASLQALDVSLKGDFDKLENGNASAEQQAEALKTLTEMRTHHGATISATLTSPLIADLKKVRDANAGKGIQIEAMRFTGGSIYVAGVDTTGTPQLLGAATVEVPGQKITEGGTLFVNASGVKITLDTVGACQAFGYKSPAALTKKDIQSGVSGTIVAKAYLNYNALLNVTVTVKMDYEKFYSLLVSTESKNGFFKTSTIKNVQETMRGDSSLSVVIVDEGNLLSKEEKETLQSAMRDRVIARALNFLNPQYVGVDPNSSPAAPAAGAGQLAKELRKCPDKWCQVGAVVVDVANAIFGGSASRQSFVQNLNVAAVETYKNTDAVEFTTDFTFSTAK